MSHEIFQFIGMRRHNGILNKTFLLDTSTAMTKDKTEPQTPATIVLHEFYKLINARTKKNLKNSYLSEKLPWVATSRFAQVYSKTALRELK